MNHEYLSKPFIEFFKTEYNLNGNQMAAVGYLKQSKSMTMGELSNKLGISKQQTSQLVKSLVKKGYVNRDINEDNRREVIVRPTKIAIDSLVEGEAIFLSNAKEQIQGFFQDDTDKLKDCLEYLSNRIPKMNFYINKSSDE